MLTVDAESGIEELSEGFVLASAKAEAKMVA
jgi:hypothetical protein